MNNTKYTEKDLKKMKKAMDEKTELVTDDVISDHFTDEFMTLIAIADNMVLGKTMAIQYALKLGYIAGRNDFKRDLARHFNL